MPILLHLVFQRRELWRRGPVARRRAGWVVEPGGFGEGALAIPVVVGAAGAGEAGEAATGRGGGGEEGEGFALLMAAVEVDCC